MSYEQSVALKLLHSFIFLFIMQESEVTKAASGSKAFIIGNLQSICREVLTNLFVCFSF